MASSESKPNAWEKADIVLKGLLPFVIALVGWLGTSYLAQRQREETNAQFYAEILTKREDADSNLRKEMFKYIIDKFLGPAQDNVANQVLGLELLAYNFHDSFDLAPLFKSTYRSALAQTPPRPDLVSRLETVSKEIIDRQVASLAEADHKWDGTIDSFEEMRKAGSAKILEKSLPPAEPLAGKGSRPINMLLEALAVDEKRKAVQVRLQIRALEPNQTLVDASFWVSYFDFPMLDNTRLPNRQRIAVVLTAFGADSAEVTVVYFPETRASIKDKPYFDEVIEDARRQGTL